MINEQVFRKTGIDDFPLREDEIMYGLDHGNGAQTLYAHLSDFKVVVGDAVEQGKEIALFGESGIGNGAHLHFEIIINGVNYDPAKLLTK